ncbi:CsiV family protein, partial [Microbulbifer sp.]|uniref:CsiV family protein n=1 Tax=Microbulbifer sp. TaxID=1908541 RepID=UPI003F2B13E0
YSITIYNDIPMTRTIQLCTALLLALAAAGAQAANYAGTTFEIEMIVFSRPGGMEQSRETWPAAPRLQYPDRWVDFQTVGGDGDGATVLFPAATRLDNKVAALNRGGSYRVLFHKAWRQVLQQKHKAPAILIDGGDSSGDHRQLEGSVTLSVSRYLHLSTNLWFSDFADGEMTSDGIPLPSRPTLTSEEPLDLMTDSTAPLIGAQPLYAQRVAVLQEERRLRSGELHYIDHPQLGVLIEVRTVDDTEE